jgi:hypothetical protein
MLSWSSSSPRLRLAHMPIIDAGIWTGSSTPGGPPTANCDDWTGTSKDVIGDIAGSFSDARWWLVKDNPQPCNWGGGRIYCLQQ